MDTETPTIKESKIKTRILILSDTHGMDFSPSIQPSQRADVAIHCGDLTDGSSLSEFRTAITLLKSLNAPLKLVIAGNHDFTLDIPSFEQKVSEATPPLDPNLVVREYGAPGEAKRLFEEEARSEGIIFLDEGTHRLTLANSAVLTVYASPWTPALGGAWGFQYHPNHGHDFPIPSDADIVVTHGPPRGVMDYTHGRERAGCADLFAAVARARPQVHCFGHIHEGWSAKLVTWRGHHGVSETTPPPSHFTAIDNERSVVIEKLAALEKQAVLNPALEEERRRKVDRYRRERCVATSHCSGDEHPLQRGRQTLFMNASIAGADGTLSQMPWLVDIELEAKTPTG